MEERRELCVSEIYRARTDYDDNDGDDDDDERRCRNITAIRVDG